MKINLHNLIFLGIINFGEILVAFFLAQECLNFVFQTIILLSFSPLIVSNLAVAIPPEQVSLDDVSLVNRRMFDWARTVGTHKFNPMTEEVEVIRKFQVSRGNHSD